MAKPKSSLTKKRQYSPFPEPKKIPEGYLLIDPNDRLNPFVTIFVALWLAIWCGVSFPLFAALLITFIASPNLENLLPVLFLSLFAGVGIVGLFWGGRSLYRVYRLKAGEIILPTYPLYRGETYRIKYRRQLRQGRTPKPGNISAEFANYEWVQYRRGTDTVTVRHELSQVDFPERDVRMGTRQLEYETQITVPQNAPLSIYANHNQVRWELRVKAHIPMMAKDTSFFVLKVLS